jgi:hypothetical protein
MLLDTCPHCECDLEHTPLLGYPIKLRYECPTCTFFEDREI